MRYFREKSEKKSYYALGTICNIEIYGENCKSTFDKISEYLFEINNRFSVFQENSLLNKINNSKGKWTVLDDESVELLASSLKYCALLEGYFDISALPLIRLWKENSIPSEKKILEAKQIINFRDIDLDINNKRIRCLKDDMCLDLGGIVKGYVSDAIVKMLRKEGIRKGILDLGGSIHVLGNYKLFTPWKIGVKNPFSEALEPIIILNMKNEAIVTSGVYERCFYENNKCYHHIIDLKTGYPSETGILSISIVNSSALEGDGYSTGLLNMSVEDAISYAKHKNLQVIIITKDKKLYISRKLKKKIISKALYAEYAVTYI